MYVKAVQEMFEASRRFCVDGSSAYTGSSSYVFWGGDIGTQEGLRASIIAAQRAAVMGYSNWGSDACGYNQQLLEQEVWTMARFQCVHSNNGSWPNTECRVLEPAAGTSYDAQLIAIWRLYARLHQRLIDYSYRHAQEASRPACR